MKVTHMKEFIVSIVLLLLFSDTIMSEFASAFLCNPYLEPVEMFIVPSLRDDAVNKFPFLPLLQCLQDDCKFTSKLLVNDSWLLHSVLSLEPPGFGKLTTWQYQLCLNLLAGSHIIS
jgi:hypothetical protein